MAETSETFQISPEMAEAYESRFVPRLFGEWAGRIVGAAGLSPGDRVLDVACGTGAVARAAADRTGDPASVVGLDLNEAMLDVARRVAPEIEWRQGDATDLPFDEDAFDAVLCQAALMFFPDPGSALHEMARVARTGGTVTVQVWDRIEDQPAYRPFIEVLGRHAGPEAVNLVSAYFVSGDPLELTGSMEAAGLDVVQTRTETSTMPFGSVDELVAVEVLSTPLGERLEEDVVGRIVADTHEALASFVTEGGGLGVPIGGHILVARPS
jgi:ubiquinone/menaquinone biosynthesis C-methylase UbiE